MNILIAGGAGFIGSHLAEAFVASGHEVIVVDGLLPQTSGTADNLLHLPKVQLINSAIEELGKLPELLNAADLLIDCVGWTRHLLALEDPHYDLLLNVTAHITLIKAIKGTSCKKVIYLGSRGQYGPLSVEVAGEDHPQCPADVQGIHKSAAEAHWRIAARLQGLDVASVLFGNTFGPRMPMDGKDIGLVGSFIRSLLNGEDVEIYGKGRMRDVVFAPDLATAIVKLSGVMAAGFEPYHLVGSHVTLEALVCGMQQICQKGSYSFQEFPAEVKNIDMGSATLSDEKLLTLIGEYPKTPLLDALALTFQTLKN
jgi:UDP-glucose 4-epimerase